jgi:hypothetical protein
MTIFGTPGGTPLNNTGFQGTQPGNAVQATLQVVNPGVGLFPPNSNNLSGDTIMASVSRATAPANAYVTNFGATSASGAGPGGVSAGRALAEALGSADANGAGVGFIAAGGAPNDGAAGGNSLGAGGMNQTSAPGGGEGSIIPSNAPATIPTLASPNVFRG